MTAARRVLVSGWVGADNVGDELIFRSLAIKLGERGAAVTTMSTRPDATRRLHGADAIGWSNATGTLAAIRSADGLILGPGGILQDETSVWNLPAHLHRVFLSRVARTPVLGMGLGVGPLRSSTGRSLVHAALRSVPVTVRDEDSGVLARSCGLRDVTVTADLAFGLPIPAAKPADRIVASLRPFSGGGGLLPARRSDMRVLSTDERIRAAASALDELSRRASLPVHLLALEPERDARYHDLIADQMTTSVTTGIATIDTVFNEFARSRLAVAMRYHAAVSAIMAARPVVVIGYSPKARSIANLLGPGGLLVTNNPAAYPEIAKGFDLIKRETDVAAVRTDLRHAERRNDNVLDDFLSRITAR
ncbi:MAG: polysaccharide pyruvyl transferase family protein [Actinomycetota bacterium]|nr:polysaccharide pyruvyl transferase family protein [Actinomycetota bacterium]